MATLLAARAAPVLSERVFFTGMAIALAVFTFVAFAPTYFLAGLFEGVTTTRGKTVRVALTPMVHVHSIVGSAWMVLLVAQTSLVAAGRRDLHKLLGWTSVLVIALIAVTATTVALGAARANAVPPGWTPPQFLLIQIGTLGGFLVLATLGVAFRRRADIHKRLMIIATISMMVPAGGRIWRMMGLSGIAPNAVGGMLLSDIFLAALIGFDLHRRGTVHPATLWAGGALLIAQPGRVLLSSTEAWQAIGRAIIG